MTELGWTANELSQEDTGEDVLVKIFDPEPNGVTSRPAGLQFLAQVKSKAEVRASASALQLACRLAVADLADWEDNQPPVVIFVWDVANRQGTWGLARDAIGLLNSTNPDWRAQQTATVRLAIANSTEAINMVRLRRQLADVALPSVANGRSLEGSLRVSFPRSTAGDAQARAFQEALDRGTPYVLESQYLKSVDVSPWFTRLYGNSLGEVATVTVNSVPRDIPVNVEISVRHPKLPEATVLSLSVKRLGLREAEVSNWSDPDAPLWVRLLVRKDEGTTFSFALNPVLRSTSRTAAVARLLERAEQGEMVIGLAGGGSGSAFRIPAGELEMPPLLKRMIRAASLFARMEAFAEIRGTPHLDRADETDVSALQAFVDACETGESLRDGVSRITGVDDSVLTDPDPIFRFDKAIMFLGAGLQFKDAFMAPADRQFVATAKRRRGGKVDIVLIGPRLRFGKLDSTTDT